MGKPDGEFEVCNRYGDRVQRGEVHVVDVEDHGTHQLVRMEFDEPATLRRRGDTLVYGVDLREILD